MYVALAVIGVILLVVSLVFDDLIDGLTPDLDYLSGPVIGAALAGFGLFGWFVADGLDAGAVIGLLGAAVGALVLGAFTWKLTTALLHQPTDATPTSEGLVGRAARVVTPVRADGIGEVLVALGGATTKYTATADTDLDTGAMVVVVAVESPTKLRVQAEEAFWS